METASIVFYRQKRKAASKIADTTDFLFYGLLNTAPAAEWQEKIHCRTPNVKWHS